MAKRPTKASLTGTLAQAAKAMPPAERREFRAFLRDQEDKEPPPPPAQGKLL